MIDPIYMNEQNEVEVTEENKERFKIHDLSSLNWAMRKLAIIEKKKKEINDFANAEIEKIKTYQVKEIGKLEDSEAFFKSLINEYALEMRATDPKFKQVTPYGSVGFRKQQPKWHYKDQELISFLKDNDYNDLIRVKEEPVKTEIKKRFRLDDSGKVYDENGQEVEGIEVEFLPDEIIVKVES